MGTNYYARIIPTKERKEHLKQLIDNDQFDKIQEEVTQMYGDSDDYTKGAVIHLGKRSGGWKFLFNPNHERYYKPTKESLMEFLQREDVVIYNEYFSFDPEDSYSHNEYTDDPDDCRADEYLWTAEQFMEMATHWGYDDPKAWDGKSYELETNPTFGYRRYGDEREKEWITRGYNPEYYEFYNDGLRWSTCCEFS